MRLLALLLLFVAFGAGAQEPPDWFSESFLELREDVAEAAKDGKRLMVYFTQQGCPYCKQLVAVNFTDPRIVEKTRRHFVGLAINIWGDREVTWIDGRKMPEKAFARMLHIQFTPTLMFLDEKGAVAHRINGYLPPDRFYTALDPAIGKASATTAHSTGKPIDLRSKLRKKPIALLLLSPGCDACDEMERHLQVPDVREQLSSFELIRLPNGADILTAGGTRTLSSSYVPALVLLDPRGREVLRTEAYLRPFHIAGSLDYVASGAYLREPSFQRFLQARAERLRSRGQSVDLWN